MSPAATCRSGPTVQACARIGSAARATIISRRWVLLLTPAAFVKDHMNRFIRLTVNGEVKQNGNTSQFIYTPEEQIEYASNILTLEPGDIFSCGTCGGVGQGTNTFLNVGDVMETEIEGLGKMRNRMVAESA